MLHFRFHFGLRQIFIFGQFPLQFQLNEGLAFNFCAVNVQSRGDARRWSSFDWTGLNHRVLAGAAGRARAAAVKAYEGNWVNNEVDAVLWEKKCSCGLVLVLGCVRPSFP